MVSLNFSGGSYGWKTSTAWRSQQEGHPQGPGRSQAAEADPRHGAGALDEEIEIKPKLLAAMKEHNLETYDFDGYMVEVEHAEENVKVKKKRAAKEDGSLA